MRKLVLAALVVSAACTTDAETPAESARPEPASRTEQLSYWQDMAPLFAEHCMQCHREGGIAPLRLDDYDSAQRFAPSIAKTTAERRMPPWSVTSDGSCGEFADSLALSDAEIARIAAWVRALMLRGWL